MACKDAEKEKNSVSAAWREKNLSKRRKDAKKYLWQSVESVREGK
jgi:hypothetical protein